MQREPLFEAAKALMAHKPEEFRVFSTEEFMLLGIKFIEKWSARLVCVYTSWKVLEILVTLGAKGTLEGFDPEHFTQCLRSLPRSMWSPTVCSNVAYIPGAWDVCPAHLKSTARFSARSTYADRSIKGAREYHDVVHWRRLNDRKDGRYMVIENMLRAREGDVNVLFDTVVGRMKEREAHVFKIMVGDVFLTRKEIIERDKRFG